MNEDVIEELREQLLEQIQTERELTDEEIEEYIDNLVLHYGKKDIPFREKVRWKNELFCSLRKLDILQELLDDSSVSEIMVNGPNQIFFERNGKIEKFHKRFSGPDRLDDVIQKIVGKCNRVVNEAMPIVDCRIFLGGSDPSLMARVNVVARPVALDGAILTIRRFPDDPITMKKMIETDSITEECAEFLKELVQAKYSILIGGGTGSGKTTFLGALSNAIPKDERIITIEDSAELRICGIDNLVRMETKPANREGAVEITIRDLIRTALRMRPDRIVVGEVRGKEAFDMLQALNTGHEGSMSTAHANSCEDMVSRLETMTLMAENLPLEAIRKQIVSGIDFLIHLGRLPDRSRKLLEVCEITGMEDGKIVLNPIYAYQAGKGLNRIGEIQKKEKLERTRKWEQEKGKVL